MYIQRSGEARRNYATILASGTTFDGNRPGTLLEINSNNLAEFIEEVYEKTDVDPSEVQYVEAYGCALKVDLILSIQNIKNKLFFIRLNNKERFAELHSS